MTFKSVSHFIALNNKMYTRLYFLFYSNLKLILIHQFASLFSPYLLAKSSFRSFISQRVYADNVSSKNWEVLLELWNTLKILTQFEKFY